MALSTAPKLPNSPNLASASIFGIRILKLPSLDIGLPVWTSTIYIVLQEPSGNSPIGKEVFLALSNRKVQIFAYDS